VKLRRLTAGAEPNLETVKSIGMKIFSMNSASGGVNRRKLFDSIKRLPEVETSYAWMVAHNLVNEYSPNTDRPGYKSPFMSELTDAGRLFLDSLNGKVVNHSAALPPVAYAVPRELYAKVAVLAEMSDQKPEELLERILSEATKTLDPLLWDIAKKNRPELLY
jgi:hypothetical protein